MRLRFDIIVTLALAGIVVTAIVTGLNSPAASEPPCCTELSIAHKQVRRAIELLEHRHPAEAQKTLESILEREKGK